MCAVFKEIIKLKKPLNPCGAAEVMSHQASIDPSPPASN
jgi:hypothetical protein